MQKVEKVVHTGLLSDKTKEISHCNSRALFRRPVRPHVARWKHRRHVLYFISLHFSTDQVFSILEFEILVKSP